MILKNKMWKKTTKILIWLIIGFIILELLLRISGFTYLTLKEHQNQITGEDKNTYTILCLGESTTADGGINSWPAQLEKILNEKSPEKKFKVINEGREVTNTAFILSRLENNLEKYKPQMVITMMGANDEHVEYENLLIKKIVSLFKNFRMYKLAQLIWTTLKNQITINPLQPKETETEENTQTSPKTNLNNSPTYA